MGNECCQNTHSTKSELTGEQIDQHLNEEKNKKTSTKPLGGIYQEQLNTERNKIIKSKEGRNENDRVKLESLKKNLEEFESTAERDNKFELRRKKQILEIEAVEKMIKGREDEIKNLRNQSTSRIN